jgi:AcrR family transcriptional regulator
MCIVNIMKRSYRMKQRADSRDQTRQKIVEAAIELHQAKGIANTSVNDIAKRAEVGRVTVYRHFADEEALVKACSGTYFQRHPLPDPDGWRSIRDAPARMRHGLRKTYAYHGQTEAMLGKVLAEARDLPIMAPYHDHWRRAAEILLDAWPAAVRQDPASRAAITLALSFETWHMLVVESGLSDDKAIALVMRLIPARGRTEN